MFFPCSTVTVALLILLSASATRAGEGDFIRLTLDGPGVAYDRVELEARVKGQSVVVRLSQHVGASYGSREAVGLATQPEFLSLVAELERGGVYELRDSSARTAFTLGVKGQLELQIDGRLTRVSLTSPGQASDGRGRRLMGRLRAWVTAITGDPPFVDGRIGPDESGFLHLETTPPGRVFVDDILVAETTPVEAARLLHGARALRIEALEGDLVRNVEVTIEKGKTTSLRMKLE